MQGLSREKVDVYRQQAARAPAQGVMGKHVLKADLISGVTLEGITKTRYVQRSGRS